MLIVMIIDAPPFLLLCLSLCDPRSFLHGFDDFADVE